MLYHIENKKYPYFIGKMPGLGTVPHIHSHLELVYICQGSALVTVDDRTYPMEQGELFLAFPHQIHFYEKRSPVSIYLLIFSGDIHPQLAALLEGKIPVCPVLKQKQLPADIHRQLETLCHNFREPSPYLRLSATGQLLSFLGQLLPLFSYREAPSDQDSVKRILGYCMEHYTEPLTLERLSRELYLSRFYISHVFTKRMGISFPKFLGKLRVDHACKLLEKNSNITQVAFASGFSSVRTFNRVFVTEKGMCPREYLHSKTK